jgi:hypothetical protein
MPAQRQQDELANLYLFMSFRDRMEASMQQCQSE